MPHPWLPALGTSSLWPCWLSSVSGPTPSKVKSDRSSRAIPPYGHWVARVAIKMNRWSSCEMNDVSVPLTLHSDFFFCLGRFSTFCVISGGSLFRLPHSSLGVYRFQTSGQPNSAPHRLGTNHYCYVYQQVLASIFHLLHVVDEFTLNSYIGPSLLIFNSRYFSTKLEKNNVTMKVTLQIRCYCMRVI